MGEVCYHQKGVNCMKRIVFEVIRAVVVGMLLPALLVGFVLCVTAPRADGHQTVPGQTEYDPGQTTLPSLPAQTEPLPEEKAVISVVVEDTLTQMELEHYILCVVLGEMPASFEPEALKAQAVVARTYALKVCGDESHHKGGAVCTVASCCQAYCPPEQYISAGGSQAALEKVKSAVEATRGQVLTYEGELVTATYFSCSGGATEDAAAVWGYEVPYLQSVESPGEEDAYSYTQTTTMTATEFRQKMAVRLKGSPQSWFGKVTYTRGGGVQTIQIGGVSYRGTTIRALLGLRSTNFTVHVDGDTITITTKGYGHRVGMSQFGADAMAVRGSTYQQILAHYYRGTELVDVKDVSAALEK